MRFSQRIGKRPVKESLQIDNIDTDLKNGLWNIVHIFHFSHFEHNHIQHLSDDHISLVIGLQQDFFKKTLDDLPGWGPHFVEIVKRWFYSAEWYDVYDFIEHVTQHNNEIYRPEVQDAFNEVLKKEVSAYRIVDGKILQITKEEEIEAIQDALDSARITSLSGVEAHLQSALSMLASKNNPDYRNSIKESISAVESITRVLSGNSKSELGKALKLIEDKIGMHPALQRAFSSLYGYTSDEGGIRHAMLEADSIAFEDAKYMLVSCSSFISYLIVKASKAGIKL